MPRGGGSVERCGSAGVQGYVAVDAHTAIKKVSSAACWGSAERCGSVGVQGYVAVDANVAMK